MRTLLFFSTWIFATHLLADNLYYCFGTAGHIAFGMGLQRKILGKRDTQASDVEVLQMTDLRSLKLKRSRSREDEGDEASGQLSPTVSGAGSQGPLHCPPAPKKPRLVLGCSLDGFKVLSVMDLRCFLRSSSV